MGGILETYEKLISQMLKQHPTPIPQTAVSPQAAASGTNPVMDNAAPAGTGHTLEKELSYILTMVQHLKKHHYREQGKFLEGLQSLQNIQVHVSKSSHLSRSWYTAVVWRQAFTD